MAAGFRPAATAASAGHPHEADVTAEAGCRLPMPGSARHRLGEALPSVDGPPLEYVADDPVNSSAEKRR